jgi:hypothetical protein
MDGGQGEVVERTALLAGGFSDKELRSMRRKGVLSPVRPGAYIPVGTGEEDRIPARRAGTGRRSSPPPAGSHRVR